LTAPSTLVSDASNVYWLDTTAYTVRAVAKSGGAVTTLAANQYQIKAGNLAVDDMVFDDGFRRPLSSTAKTAAIGADPMAAMHEVVPSRREMRLSGPFASGRCGRSLALGCAPGSSAHFPRCSSPAPPRRPRRRLGPRPL
jgi:hypothetical protein